MSIATPCYRDSGHGPCLSHKDGISPLALSMVWWDFPLTMGPLDRYLLSLHVRRHYSLLGCAVGHKINYLFSTARLTCLCRPRHDCDDYGINCFKYTVLPYDGPRRGYQAYVGPYRKPERDIVMKKPDAKANAEIPDGTMPDPKFLTDYPSLSEYLSATKWDDGTLRKPCKLSVSVKDSGINLALNDDNFRQSCYSWGRGLQEALETMEEGLTSGQAEWRSWSKKGKN